MGELKKVANYKVFVINLDRSISRWHAMAEQLEKLGLPFERFKAIDGNSESNEFLNRYYSEDLNKKKYYVSLSKSEIACYISHLKVCQKIVSENLDYGVILEDDIELEKSFKYLPILLNSINNWEYVKLIAPFKRKKIISRNKIISNELPDDLGNLEYVRWEKLPVGTQAYAIKKETAKKFISMRSSFFRPIDVDLQFTWEVDLNVSGISPSLCVCSSYPSEISRKRKYHYPFSRLLYKLKYFISLLGNRK